jgi:hypothetical protein
VGDLVRLAVERTAGYSVATACTELQTLIGMVQAEADAAEEAAAVDQPEKLEEARQWVKWLGHSLRGERASQQSPSQSQRPSQEAQVSQTADAKSHEAEEASEVAWAQQYSFQNVHARMPGGHQCTFAQLMQQGAASTQDALGRRQFDGDLSFIGRPHAPGDLKSLARRALAALDAYESDSSEDGGGGGGDSGHVSENDSSSEGGNEREDSVGDAGNERRRKRPKMAGVRSVVRDSIWFPDEDPMSLPAAEREAEAVLRTASKLALVQYYEKLQEYDEQQSRGGQETAAGGPRPLRPSMRIPRIWVKDDRLQAQGRWEKRLYVAEMNIRDWGMAYLSDREKRRIRALPPSTTCMGKADRGHKRVEKDSIFIMRSDFDADGLGLYANKFLPRGTVLGQYVGKFFQADSLAQHNAGADGGSHFLSLRIKWANMPVWCTGIDGAVKSQQEADDRCLFDLEYFRTNGPASLANNDGCSRNCNCKLVVEYRSYDKFSDEGDLFIDDEHCPKDADMKKRV